MPALLAAPPLIVPLGAHNQLKLQDLSRENIGTRFGMLIFNGSLQMPSHAFQRGVVPARGFSRLRRFPPKPKVYPAPGMPGTTNIEIFAPVAKTLFEGLKKSATETIEEGASVFEIRKNDSYLCTRKLVNGAVTDHFCTLHMQANGTVAPGHAGEFDVDGRDPSGARGIGVIAVYGKSLRVTEKAAEALFGKHGRAVVFGQIQRRRFHHLHQVGLFTGSKRKSHPLRYFDQENGSTSRTRRARRPNLEYQEDLRFRVRS